MRAGAHFRWGDLWAILCFMASNTTDTPMKMIFRILPIALIVLGPMVMLYPIWSNPVSAGEDDVVYYYPLRKMLANQLRQGSLPLYNSLEATGEPLMADPQSALMYPPTWMFAVLDAKLAYALSVFLGFCLAGAGTYLYLRRIGLVRPAAMFGAVGFMFCGFLVGHRVHLGMIHTACWVPWGLWCIEGLRRKALPTVLCMVPILFLSITAGHWPTLIQMLIVWTGYMLLRARPLLPAVGAALLAIILAAALASPQILMTTELLASTTRHRIGYATAGENSFFPAAGVLALFPMLMGSRTPNFFPQRWWGPWHLCEMLGYVGLITLGFAGSVVWRVYRKPRSNITDAESPLLIPGQSDMGDLRDLVRKWTWVVIAAMVWMLGYYLPTYRLVHMLPVLGIMRCPGRMVLAVDMAFAILAAICMHMLILGARTNRNDNKVVVRLAKTVRRTVSIVLPLLMLVVLGLVKVAGLMLEKNFPGKVPFFNGGAREMIEAVSLSNPAVWVPIALVIATGLGVRFWLVRPHRRFGILIVILLADLFFITRFVDVPGSNREVPDPDVSPAAAWLGRNAPTDEPYRVWGLSETYHHRPGELLLPKTCESLGFSSITGYGPFQSPSHAHLLGFRIFGTNRNWEQLIRRNYLLSLYNVRYILAADPKFRRVIESVRTPTGPPPPDSTNLLGEQWSLKRAKIADGTLQLRTPFLWSPSIATQGVRLEGEVVYRISLDARAPQGGAANYLRAEVLQNSKDRTCSEDDSLGLTVFSEQIGEGWRHFEWTFRSPPQPLRNLLFQVLTMSERTILVRNLTLRRSHWYIPILLGEDIPPGEPVYRKLVELPPRRSGDPPVAIYENLLCKRQHSGAITYAHADSETLERIKWPADSSISHLRELPDLAIPPIASAGPTSVVLIIFGIFGCVLVGVTVHRTRNQHQCDR